MSSPPQRENPALTRREREVVALIAQGHSNSEIAREHRVAIGTVKVQVSSIMRKLGAKNRTHAVRLSRTPERIE